MGSVEQSVKEIIVERFNVKEEEIKPEMAFVGDLGADSLDLAELVMALEDKFGLRINEEDSDKLTTVQQAVDYIESRMKTPKP